MIVSPAAALVCFLAIPQSSDWVVQDILLPLPLAPGSESVVAVVNPLGDLDDDGFADFILAGGAGRPYQSQQDRASWGQHLSGHWKPMADPMLSYFVIGNYYYSSGWWLPQTLPLQAGQQSTVALVNHLELEIDILSKSDLSPVGVVPRPSVPPGGTGVTGWEAIYPIGDVNADGFDEVFAHGSAVSGFNIFALIDGATMAIQWEHVESDRFGFVRPTLLARYEGSQDLNGDGMTDVVVTFNRWDSIQAISIAVQVALSGLDGSVLWRHSIVGEGSGDGNLGGEDIDGDGVMDFLWNLSQTLRMTSGTDGSLIWAASSRYLDHLYPPPLWTYSTENPSFYTGVSGDPDGLELVQYVTGYNTQTLERMSGFAHLDAATGAFLRWEELPEDMQPWFPDATESLGQNFYYLMGDIDQDGFTEIMHPAAIAAYDDPLISGLPMAGLIYSQTTLRVDETHPVGSPLILEADFPSSPGKDFRVLLSDGFGLLDGLMLGTWRTNLQASPLLDFCLRSPTLSGTLDAQGQGGVALAIPPDPNLVGRTLYSRAVVLEQPGSTRIRSVSTLGVTELQ